MKTKPRNNFAKKKVQKDTASEDSLSDSDNLEAAPKRGPKSNNKIMKRGKKKIPRYLNAQSKKHIYDQSDPRELKNMKACYKRRIGKIHEKMDDAYERCGATGFYVSCSEVPVNGATFQVYTTPSGSIRRPIIPQQTVNSIANALSQSLKYHPGNKRSYDPSAKIYIDAKNAGIFLKRFIKKQQQEENFEDLAMFSKALGRKCETNELVVLASALNSAKIGLQLGDPVTDYLKEVVLGFISMLLSVIDLNELSLYDDESKTDVLINKIYWLQKEIQSCYQLENAVDLYVVRSDDFGTDDEGDDTEDEIITGDDNDATEDPLA